MKTFKLTLASCLLAQSVIAHSSPLEYSTLPEPEHLRRLSFVTTDRNPPFSDEQKLKGLADGDATKWFDQKAQQYISGEPFTLKMIANLSTLFRINAPVLGAGGNSSAQRVSSMHLLFYRIISKNLSWDELLTSQVVGFSTLDNDRISGDFYKGVATQQQILDIQKYMIDRSLLKMSQSMSGQYNVKSIEDTARFMTIQAPEVAGVLSDPHFLDRYWTTPINQNRKRSAAIFRVFLCDEMRAVILPDEATQKEIENAGLDQTKRTAHLTLQNSNQLHATDPKCSTCHYKLDPMGKVFKSVSDTLTSKPSPGALTFKRRSGELVTVPFRNAQELAKALVAQPEYVSCQVHHFWNWFIGSDVAMDHQTEDELINKFNSVGRRPKDFALYLVNRKDFFSFPKLTVNNITFRHVSGLLKDCQSCHNGEVDAPAISSMPFDLLGDQSQHGAILDKIVSKLDLLGDGSKASMPPLRSGWKVANADRARLMAWLAAGAPDDAGTITWHNESLKGQLKQRVAAESISFDLRPSFDFTASRRVTANAYILNLLLLSHELGIPTSDLESWATYNMTSKDLKSVDLESGAALTNPNSAYAKFIKSSTEYFKYDLSEGFRTIAQDDSILRKLNLAFLIDLKKSGQVEGFNYIQPTPDIDLQVALALHERLIGSKPAPGSPDYERLKNFVVRLAQSDSGKSLEGRIVGTLTQLLMSNRYLIY